MFKWGAILAALLGLANRVVSMLLARKAYEAGKDAVVIDQQEKVIGDVLQAEAARNAVRHDVARKPDSLRDDDGFKRAD